MYNTDYEDMHQNDYTALPAAAIISYKLFLQENPEEWYFVMHSQHKIENAAI